MRWDGHLPEYDAFGREVGEDTLAEAGWRRPSPDPSLTRPSVPPPAGRAEAGTPRVRRVRVKTGGRLAVVVLLLVAATLWIVGSAVKGLVEEIGDALPLDEVTLPAGPGPGEGEGAGSQTAGAARGLEAGSLLRPQRLASALAELRDVPGNPTMLRVAANRIDGNFVAADRMRIVQVDADGELRQVAEVPAGADTGLRLAAIDPSAPRRLLVAAERAHGLAPADVDYLAVMDFSGAVLWTAFYRGGPSVQGDARGRLTRRLR